MLLKRECQEMFITPPENVIKKDVDFLQFHRGFFQFFSFKNSVKTKPNEKKTIHDKFSGRKSYDTAPLKGQLCQ